MDALPLGSFRGPLFVPQFDFAGVLQKGFTCRMGRLAREFGRIWPAFLIWHDRHPSWLDETVISEFSISALRFHKIVRLLPYRVKPSELTSWATLENGGQAGIPVPRGGDQLRMQDVAEDVNAVIQARSGT